MKNEKELKKEIEKLEIYMTKNPFYENYLDNKLDCLKTQLKTLQERNAEVKQVIEEFEFLSIPPYKVKKELLQKLGLGK